MAKHIRTTCTHQLRDCDFKSEGCEFKVSCTEFITLAIYNKEAKLINISTHVIIIML